MRCWAHGWERVACEADAGAVPVVAICARWDQECWWDGDCHQAAYREKGWDDRAKFTAKRWLERGDWAWQFLYQLLQAVQGSFAYCLDFYHATVVLNIF